MESNRNRSFSSHPPAMDMCAKTRLVVTPRGATVLHQTVPCTDAAYWASCRDCVMMVVASFASTRENVSLSAWGYSCVLSLGVLPAYTNSTISTMDLREPTITGAP